LAAIVVLTTVAARDLSQVQDWFGQPGAAKRSKRRAQRIVAAIKRLETGYARHPADRFNPADRQFVVEDYVVSYRWI
jgi:hypothetical protein